MKRSKRPWNKLVGGCGGLGIALVVAASSGVAGAAPPIGSSVLNPTYAKSIGFTKTVQPAKQSKVTSQKGCTSSVGAEYTDVGGKTGLVSATLLCSSNAAAAQALTTERKHLKVYSAFKAPKKLGSTAFVTTPQPFVYLIYWVNGSKVAITGMDVNIAASSSTASTVAPSSLTAPQMKTLSAAALKQNSLYH